MNQDFELPEYDETANEVESRFAIYWRNPQIVKIKNDKGKLIDQQIPGYFWSYVEIPGWEQDEYRGNPIWTSEQLKCQVVRTRRASFFVKSDNDVVTYIPQYQENVDGLKPRGVTDVAIMLPEFDDVFILSAKGMPGKTLTETIRDFQKEVMPRANEALLQAFNQKTGGKATTLKSHRWWWWITLENKREKGEPIIIEAPGGGRYGVIGLAPLPLNLVDLYVGKSRAQHANNQFHLMEEWSKQTRFDEVKDRPVVQEGKNNVEPISEEDLY